MGVIQTLQASMSLYFFIASLGRRIELCGVCESVSYVILVLSQNIRAFIHTLFSEPEMVGTFHLIWLMLFFLKNLGFGLCSSKDLP